MDGMACSASFFLQLGSQGLHTEASAGPEEIIKLWIGDHAKKMHAIW